MDQEEEPQGEGASYVYGSPFPGRIGRTRDVSEAAWTRPPRAPVGAPNIVIVVLDDTGFGHLGCYGSPIRTPNIDRLAASGIRLNSMHVAPMCMPTRSCILTGRHPHVNGMGTVTDTTIGFPGYDGVARLENGYLSEILVANGYNTYAIGKWHQAPEDMMSAAGPYDRWPLGRGFERFYGFLDWGTSQYHPDLIHDNHRVRPPRTPEEGYHLTEDLADHAISFIADAKHVDPDKPFLLYFCTGAMHAPLHVPETWSERYAGMFDGGWSVFRQRVFARQLDMGIIPAGTQLPPPDQDIPEWESLSVDERRRCARLMEVFAGYLEHTDAQLGRILDFLEEIGQADDTLVIVMADNGASPEGGRIGAWSSHRSGDDDSATDDPGSTALTDADLRAAGDSSHLVHYPMAWAWAGDTPFRRWKRETYRGGVSVPFILHWPAGIADPGRVEDGFAHATDILPTILDVLGIAAPATIKGVTQAPLHGTSFAGTLGGAKIPVQTRVEYFESFAHRAIYQDGWRAVCPWPGTPYVDNWDGQFLTAADLRRIDAEAWELYHVATDFAEATNLAAEEPARLQALIDLWYREAERNQVLPLDGLSDARMLMPRPRAAARRDRYVYYPGTQMVPEKAAADVLHRAHIIVADVESMGEGVLISHGGIGWFGGYSMFVMDGRLGYIHNHMGSEEHRVISERRVPPGPCSLQVDFEPIGEPDLAAGRGSPGRVRLSIDGELVGEGVVPVTMPFLLGGGIEVGRDAWSRPPVTLAYPTPFEFTGRLTRVTVTVAGVPHSDVPLETRIKATRE